MRGIIIASALIGLIAILYRVYLIERSKSKKKNPSVPEVLAPFNRIFGPEVFFPINSTRHPKIANILLVVFYIAFFAVIVLTAINSKKVN